jgi:hypothetical protein
MDFFALVAFLALYYLRPQEWFTVFNSLHFVQLLSIVAIWVMVQKNRIQFKQLVRTPLDWLILAYFVWTLIAGFQPRQTFSGIQSVILFYFAGVTTLNSIPRITRFLGWWCAFMFIIAALALLSTVGFDPLGSYDITQGAMKGRLILNLSVFDNPNALAHSVVPAVPLFYYLVYWRHITKKPLLILLIVPLYCVYLTVSKGAFLCGFATVLATLTFGRSRIWQIIILILAVGVGYGALFALPRMNELKNSKMDPAIQGRVAAMTYGLSLMRNNWFGIGLGNFESYFSHYGPLEKHLKLRVIPGRRIPLANGGYHDIDETRMVITTYTHFSKATHGAYNQNGAELGYVGLFLFVGILYCCIRTLLLTKCEDDAEERIRRALFATVVAYAVSSWMVDFAYRPTFFMFVAAISAFHRLLIAKHSGEVVTVEVQTVRQARPWLRGLRPIQLPGIPLPGYNAPVPAASMAAGMTSPVTVPLLRPVTSSPGVAAGSGRILPWRDREEGLGDTLRKKFIWNRLGILDILIMLMLTYAAILYWQHLIRTM